MKRRANARAPARQGGSPVPHEKQSFARTRLVLARHCRGYPPRVKRPTTGTSVARCGDEVVQQAVDHFTINAWLRNAAK